MEINSHTDRDRGRGQKEREREIGRRRKPLGERESYRESITRAVNASCVETFHGNPRRHLHTSCVKKNNELFREKLLSIHDSQFSTRGELSTPPGSANHLKMHFPGGNCGWKIVEIYATSSPCNLCNFSC